MFTAENKSKLIDELNNQLKTNTFYAPNFAQKVNTVEKNKTKKSSLYKPFMSSDVNPLTKPVYNYSSSSSTPVYGIAFEKDNLNSEHLISRSHDKKDNSYNSKMFSDSQELNMCDILPNTDESAIINFKAIPKEMALAKITKNTNFWTRDIDIIGTLKSVFKK